MPTRKELVSALAERYRGATRKEKSRILDEFVATTGCHRKHAVRLLRHGLSTSPRTPGPRSRLYDEAVREALVVVWEAADRICGKRLKVVLPELVATMERHGHFSLDDHVRQRLLTVSAATIDRLLTPVRAPTRTTIKRRRTTRVGRQVPVRTFADWKDAEPGYFEVDFVAHNGGSTSGSFVHSLVLTDVASGWTECMALVAREQSLVVHALEVVQTQLPVVLRGIDTDNDSAFINDTVLSFCDEHGIEFTRSRAYRKNDQAWIEQKNGAVVRRFIGYERFSGMVAVQCLARLYQAIRLFVNYFQPSFKLRSKTRDGARVSKSYFAPATPCDRLLRSAQKDKNFDPRFRGAGRVWPAWIDTNRV